MNSTAIHELTDTDFVALLRQRTDDYLKTVEAWESAYAKYYRLWSPGQVSSDLAPHQRSFLDARSDLKKLLPRARRLCLKHDLKYPFELIVRVDLGEKPQALPAPAIGRGERNAVQECIAALEAVAFAGPGVSEASLPIDGKSGRRRGIPARIYNQFF